MSAIKMLIGNVKFNAWKRKNIIEDYFDIGDIKIYYATFGDGEPVFLLHGGMADYTSWFFQIKELAKHFQIVAPDTRAHGRTTDSDKPLSYELLASDISQLMEKLDIKKASFVGWSDGGCTALVLALKYPELVNKLVLIETPYNISNYHPEIFENFSDVDPNNLPKEYKFIKRAYEKVAADPNNWLNLIEKEMDLAKREPNFTLDQLKNIASPALIIFGGEEQLFPLKVMQEMTNAMPNARLEVIPGGTHIVLMEKPKLVNQLIVRFLRNFH
ncbi:MAG: alpha/beta hydrolase [Candidatus Heimdallarchaeota archaeon]|nr:alpha/beta hydrolase [Candidatus Heimdallarchaeota archaeon]